MELGREMLIDFAKEEVKDKFETLLLAMDEDFDEDVMKAIEAVYQKACDRLLELVNPKEFARIIIKLHHDWDKRVMARRTE